MPTFWSCRRRYSRVRERNLLLATDPVTVTVQSVNVGADDPDPTGVVGSVPGPAPTIDVGNSSGYAHAPVYDGWQPDWLDEVLDEIPARALADVTDADGSDMLENTVQAMAAATSHGTTEADF